MTKSTATPDKVIAPEEAAQKVKDSLEKHNLPAVQSVEVKDPISGETRIISLDRTGHTEASLIQTLADPELSRDRKDFAISMYLYERGAQSTSMIVDLMRYKGAHTKETHVFKSQIRFDFEALITTFCRYLDEQVDVAEINLGVDIRREAANYTEWVKNRPEGMGTTYYDYKVEDKEPDLATRCMWTITEMAMRTGEEANKLRKTIRNISEARARDKGKGVYISKDGVPYTVDNIELDDIIKADRAATEAINKEDI